MYPLIVVACLLGSQLAYRQPLTLPIVYLALVAFIVSTLAFGRFTRTPVHMVSRFAPAARHWRLLAVSTLCSHVFVRWGAIVAGLLFLGFAIDVGALFSRKVLLTWFVVTPLALCLSRVARLRSIQ